MDMRAARYFLAAAETGSLTAAARRCFVTQPALSRQIAGLEREFGVVLFERTRTGLRLTRAGHRFLPIARDLDHRFRHGAEVMHSLATGELSFTFVCRVPLLDMLLAPFVAETGAPIVDVRTVDSHLTFSQFSDGGVDAAIGAMRPSGPLQSRPVMRSAVTVHTRPDSDPFPDGRPVDIAELVGHRLVVAPVGSRVRSLIEETAESRGLAIDCSQQASTPPMAQALAAAGRGHALTLGPSLFGLRPHPLVSEGRVLAVTEWMAWPTGHYADDELDALALRLREWVLAGTRDHGVLLEPGA